MFERNKIDNTLQLTTIPAEVTLHRGEVLKGRFLINASRAIFDVLNGDSQFLEFETYAGDRAWLSKATLASVKIISVPSAAGLKSRLADVELFDPHQTLGVTAASTWDEIRHAYLKLSKIYHPDLFAGTSLPREVSDYLSAMARRINAAYRALEIPQQANKRADIEKAKPVFTSPQRA